MIETNFVLNTVPILSDFYPLTILSVGSVIPFYTRGNRTWKG